MASAHDPTTGSAPLRVDIHYRRPPDDEQVFTQALLLDRDDVRVTFAQGVDFDSPVVIHDQVVLESGSDAVWFTFPGAWHDIGRFHRADGTFTGIYANILTPPVFLRSSGRTGLDGPGADRDTEGEADSGGASGEREEWRTTDLFLDVWLPEGGELSVLDRDQLEEALAKGWVSPGTAARARKEVDRIRAGYEEGRWPPEVVEEWTLERARKVAGGRAG